MSNATCEIPNPEWLPPTAKVRTMLGATFAGKSAWRGRIDSCLRAGGEVTARLSRHERHGFESNSPEGPPKLDMLLNFPQSQQHRCCPRPSSSADRAPAF